MMSTGSAKPNSFATFAYSPSLPVGGVNRRDVRPLPSAPMSTSLPLSLLSSFREAYVDRSSRKAIIEGLKIFTDFLFDTVTRTYATRKEGREKAREECIRELVEDRQDFLDAMTSYLMLLRYIAGKDIEVDSYILSNVLIKAVYVPVSPFLVVEVARRITDECFHVTMLTQPCHSETLGRLLNMKGGR